MSLKKIIFLVLAGATLIGTAITTMILTEQTKTKKKNPTSTLSIWVTEGTSEQYDGLIAGFRKAHPDFAGTKIDVRVFPESEQYHDILLSTLSEDKWPDIFMLDAGRDEILEDKIEPIPSEVLSFGNFEKEYDDLFLPLIVTTGKDKNIKTFLRWVPLGYETLWVYYNKSLISNLPKTWNELELSYSQMKDPILPSNLGGNSTFTKNGTDIVGQFLLMSGNNTYREFASSNIPTLAGYLSFSEIAVGWSETVSTAGTDWVELVDNDGNPIVLPEKSIQGEWSQSGISLRTLEMASKGKTPAPNTLDLFIEGKIQLVFWYPSMIRELEYAQKRVWEKAKIGLVFTEPLLKNELTKSEPLLAKYTYFWLSKQARNVEMSVAFLQYLLSEEAQGIYLKSFPTKIAARKSYHKWQLGTPLSLIFAKTRIDAFLPTLERIPTLYTYGRYDRFRTITDDYIDRADKIDKNNFVTDNLVKLGCEIDTVLQKKLTKQCENLNLLK